MNKTKILYIIASSSIGGAENFIYKLLKMLDSNKFEKYIACPRDGYYEKEFGALTKKAIFIDPRRSFMNPKIILRISSFIKENKIDIIHTMLYTSDFCGIVARLLAGRSKVLNTINGLNFLIFKKNSLRLKRRIASFLYRFIYRYSDKLIAVSEAVKKDLVSRRGIKVNPKKIETVLAAGTNSSYHNFQEEDIEYLRPTGRLKDGELTISAIGKLNEAKDYDNMLEAFSLAVRRNPYIKLFIAGDGPDRERLQSKVSKLNLDKKVNFLGVLQEKKKNALLSLTDIFIMSSKTEGCPTSLLEAMYFGKPAIATMAGGIPEIVKNNETGLLVSAGNPAKLADAILHLADDREMRMRFGEKAKQIFTRHFTPEHMLKAYENIYDEAKRSS